MQNSRATYGVALLIAVITVAFATRAEAQAAKASAVNAEVAVQNGIAQARFSIEIANAGASPLSNVVAVFSDGLEVAIGDVAAEGSAVSQPESRTIDISELPSNNIAVPITLKFSVDGNDVEEAATLYLRVQQ